MDQVIQLLAGILVIAVVGYGMYLGCQKFFPNFQPALWVCGVILLIIVCLFANKVLSGASWSWWPLRR